MIGGMNSRKEVAKEVERLSGEQSSLFIQVGRIEEKLDNLSNKMSFEHGHIKQDTDFVSGALKDMTPTLVELEHLKRDLLGKISDVVSPKIEPMLTVQHRGSDKIKSGIIELMGDGRERSVTEITNLIAPNFPDYQNNSLRVVVSRKLGKLVSEETIQTRDSKNKRIYFRKV